MGSAASSRFAGWRVFLLVLFAASVQAAVDPIVIKGSHFFYQTNGSEFFIRGVAYQDQGHFAFSSTSIIDPFGDGPTCARDVPYLRQLGVNVVRAYAVNPRQDHSECMKLLADAGIYVLTDMSGGKTEIIDRNAPAWNYMLYDRYTSVVDAFQNYTNVLGFFAGNEVVTASNTTAAMAFVKAAARDVKAYMKKKNYRNIPVGYATGDFDQTRMVNAEYLNCGNQDDIADFFALNLYSWCGNSSLTQSGYNQRIQDFRNYSVPVFLSEYGCDTPSPRNFTEVQAIYGSSMNTVFSGGVVYQFYAAEANYGLVTVMGDTVSKAPDFAALSSQIALISPSTTNMKTYTPTNTVQQSCPGVGSSWSASPTLPPAPYARLCACMMQSLSCIANANVSSQDISQSLSKVCGVDSSACAGVQSNAMAGSYGAFTVCNGTEILSWTLNQYYLSQNKNDATCTSLGGVLQQPGAAAPSDCSILLRQAGPSGTGTITSTPGIPASASSTGSNSNSNAKGADKPRRLSSAAHAGIALAVLVFVGLLAGLVLFLLHRRKRREKQQKLVASQADQTLADKPELPDTQVRPNELEAADKEPPVLVELEAPHGVSEVGQR